MSQALRLERARTQKPSKWRVVAYVLAGTLGLVLAACALGLILVLHTSPPPVIRTDPIAAKRLQEELQAAQTAVAGSQRVVQADETELNSLIREYLQSALKSTAKNGGAVLRDMKLNLTADRLQLYVLANYLGKDMSFLLEGRVRSENGYLNFEPIKGKIGSLSIPQTSLKKAVSQMLVTPETRKLMRLPDNLRDLHVEDGKLVVMFK
jgi:hypothetical protein